MNSPVPATEPVLTVSRLRREFEGGAVAVADLSFEVRPGEVVVLSIVAPIATEAPRVLAFDREIAADQDGDTWCAIVGVDLDVKPGTYRVTVESGGADNAARSTRVSARYRCWQSPAPNIAMTSPLQRLGEATTLLDGGRRRLRNR